MIGLFCLLLGRDGGIRTRDPLHPMQVRYQAALRPEAVEYTKLSHAGEAKAYHQAAMVALKQPHRR
jgi:hypothetical protein